MCWGEEEEGGREGGKEGGRKGGGEEKGERRGVCINIENPLFTLIHR